MGRDVDFTGRTELALLELELVEALGTAGFLGHARRHRGRRSN